jgi:HEAT repeat protein
LKAGRVTKRRRKTDRSGQFDLFGPRPGAEPQAVPAEPRPVRPIAELPDDMLIDALNLHLFGEPPAEPRLIAALEEVGRRREARAVPFLVRTCRRFAAFDHQHSAPEVVAALNALAHIGPATAADPVVELVQRNLFGPVSTAAALQCFAGLRTPSAEALIRPGLAHADSRVRVAACGLAGALRRSEAPALLEPLIDDPDRSVAKAARLALGELGYKPVREHLEELLERATPIDIPAVAHALVAVADDDTPILLGRVAERCDETGRTAIVKALGQIDRPQAVTALIRLARDTRATVRLAVAEALSRQEDPRIPGTLGNLSQDPDQAVRERAIGALKAVDAVGDW